MNSIFRLINRPTKNIFHFGCFLAAAWKNSNCPKKLFCPTEGAAAQSQALLTKSRKLSLGQRSISAKYMRRAHDYRQ